MPNIEDMQAALRQWCKGRGVDRGVSEFVDFLEKKQAGYLLPHLLRELSFVAEAEAQQRTAHIETAMPFASDQADQLDAALGGVEISEETKETLLGGATVSHAGHRIDGSIKGRLQTLTNYLRISHE